MSCLLKVSFTFQIVVYKKPKKVFNQTVLWCKRVCFNTCCNSVDGGGAAPRGQGVDPEPHRPVSLSLPGVPGRSSSPPATSLPTAAWATTWRPPCRCWATASGRTPSASRCPFPRLSRLAALRSVPRCHERRHAWRSGGGNSPPLSPCVALRLAAGSRGGVSWPAAGGACAAPRPSSAACRSTGFGFDLKKSVCPEDALPWRLREYPN